ncbi:MAG: outer membrane beta-barrel protein, partial [Leptospiraceae bacterium]|nr:outer membrane beta-barrel protein [Leptospiraceae bacterium]
GMAANSGAYIKEGIPQGTIPGLNVSLGRDGNKVKRINNTYAFFLQYFFTKEMGLGLRYEYIDDSRYGGPYASNPPRAGITPQYRYDLLTLDQYGLRASGNLGQVRTFTITPTYIYSEHIIVKLDFRRDWGMGDQFIDERGRPCSYQNGVILGLVAKF